MANEASWPKMELAGLPQESIKVDNHFDRLCDGLLTEILLRLPCCKSVIQSTTVSKRWAALVCHPYFVPKFIALKFGYLNKEYTFSFVIHFRPSRACRFEQRFESFFRPSIFNVEDQDSSFSPFGDYDIASVFPVASCKDLLLYYKHDNAKFDYYISNVQNRQCVVLPSLPDYYGKVNVVGFICDTLFNCDRELTLYHYSVVALHCTPNPSNKFSAHIFSSHSDTQWCNRVLSLPKACRVLYPQPSGGFCFCFDGKLNFSCAEGFFGFDRTSIVDFDGEIQCHLVEWPVRMLLLEYHRVSVSQENLYLTSYRSETSTLSVWVLQDYEEGNWMLQHTVETREWVSRDSWMESKFKNFSGHRVLGLHPNCIDYIYVVVPGHIFLCNLTTKMVELACDIPVANENYINQFYALPVIFQSWPTPHPCFARRLKDGANATPASCSGL